MTPGLPPVHESSRVDVTVLVLVRDEERHVEDAIAGMQGQDFDGSVEFLLLDGGSTDGTLSKLAAVTEKDGRFRLHMKAGWSIPRRLNYGLRTARGELIARMDAHAVFPPHYLTDGVRRLAAGDVASVSGPAIACGDGRWSRRIALAMHSRLGRGGASFRTLSAREIEVDSGFCGLWSRQLLLAHGGWDEQAVKGEDMELAFRIRRAGGRIVCVPSMAARYAPRETLPRLAVQYWRYAERRAWAATVNPRVLRRSHLLPPAVAASVLAAALKRAAAARHARRILGIYGAAVVIESVRLGRRRAAADLAALPVVFLTMHISWGFGFLFGFAINGWRGIVRLARGRLRSPLRLRREG